MVWETLGMARKLRIEFPGAIYHVTCRMLGDRRSILFRDNNDRIRLLDRLAERVEQFNIRLYLYVLMTNHTPLVFETPEPNCSRFMHSLLTAYTTYFNLRHNRHGHLFDGRFKSKLVDGDDYLLALTRYVHLNPVCVGSVKHMPIADRQESLREYPWSTYRSYIGASEPEDFVSYGPMLSEMATTERSRLDTRQRGYRKFVETGLAQEDREFRQLLKASPRSIGGEGFRAWVDDLYREMIEKHDRPEDVSFRHAMEPLDKQTVLDIVVKELALTPEEMRRSRRGSPLRAVAAYCLMKHAGLSQRDTAEILGVSSGAAISKQLAKYSRSFNDDRTTRRRLKRIADKVADARKRRPKG